MAGAPLRQNPAPLLQTGERAKHRWSTQHSSLNNSELPKLRVRQTGGTPLVLHSTFWGWVKKFC